MEAINLFNMPGISSINNPLANLKNKDLGQNSLSVTDTNNSKNLFSQMLNMILGGDVNKQNVKPEQLILEGEVSKLNVTSEQLISNVEIENLIENCNQDEKSSTQLQNQIDYNNLMSMMFGLVQNSEYTEFRNTNIENGSDYSILQSNTMINEIVNGNNKNDELNFQSLTRVANSNDEAIINKISFMDNNLQKEQINIKNNLSSDNDADKGYNNVQNKILALQSTENVSKDLKSNFVLSGKTSSRDTVIPAKNKIDDDNNESADLKGNSIENITSVFTQNNIDKTNKIIEVSDESSEIKKAVLLQVEDKINFMASGKEGMQEVTMELYPKSLGKVNVKMLIENGKINIEIMALDTKTSNILMSSVNELTKSLQHNNNYSTVNIVVADSESNQFNQSNLNYSQNHNQREQSQTNKKFYDNNDDLDESDIISELINLRNIKLNKVI